MARAVHALTFALCAAAAGTNAQAQGWSVDVSGGQTQFDALSSHVSSTNLIVGLRYDAFRDLWVYGGGAAPLRSGDIPWGVFAAGGRLHALGSATSRASIGVDLGGHGYLYRDPPALLTGTGGAVEIMPFTTASAGASRFELRGGWRGHTSSYAGQREQRGVFDGAARVAYGSAVQVGAEARVARAAEGTFPFAGVSLAYRGAAPVRISVEAGRWIGGGLDDLTWSAGTSYRVTPRMTVWASVRQDGRDPLYWNPSRRTWNIGLTTRLGRSPLAGRGLPTAKPGPVDIRLPVSDAPGPELWIAGSFNEWRPVPMRREGRHWVIRVPLTAGLYHYAFRSAGGTWFVPASVAGRRSDGFGGHVAVLVVAS